eukprot:jgi/Psemu1/315869/fgenesh1_kg.2493_\
MRCGPRAACGRRHRAKTIGIEWIRGAALRRVASQHKMLCSTLGWIEHRRHWNSAELT